MLFDPARENHDGWLIELPAAPASCAQQIASLVAGTRQRLQAAGKSMRVARLDQWAAAGAWTDLALAMIEFEAPAWRLRRLVYDDVAWHCALSRQPDLPVEIDDLAEGSHDAPHVAILNAFVAARQRTRPVRETATPRVPRVRQSFGRVVSCDNFS